MKKLFYSLLAARRLVFAFRSNTSPFILPFSLPKQLSTRRETDTVNACLRNPFAHFAERKFNISSADIAGMFKKAPHLERLQSLEKVEQFVEMLNKHGFNQHQIARIMKTAPRIFTMSVERVVEPKLQRFEDWGFQREDVAKLVTKAPWILQTSLDNVLLRNITFFKNIFQATDLLVKFSLRVPRVFLCDVEKILKPSLVFWEGHGVRGKEAAKMFLKAPRLLTISSLTPAKIRLLDKIGLTKESNMYKYVLQVVASARMETLEAKLQNLQQLYGLSVEQTMELFRVLPSIFVLSERRVRQKRDFIVNTMELPASFVLKYPRVLGMSLEKVLKPRFLVLQGMKSMNEDQPRKLYTVLMMTEAKFIGQIVKVHPQCDILYSIYQKAIADVSKLQ